MRASIGLALLIQKKIRPRGEPRGAGAEKLGFQQPASLEALQQFLRRGHFRTILARLDEPLQLAFRFCFRT
jgi:hypothetical protein